MRLPSWTWKRPYAGITFRTLLSGALVFMAMLSGASGQHQRDTILFIRGGSGTVGFLEGGSDTQAADVFNVSTQSGNHGWGELRAALVAEGFRVEQRTEDPVVSGVPTPVPLDTMNLNRIAVLVFGSNNADYHAAQVDAVEEFIRDGGAALFISDANFGSNWGDAPSSDQAFLDRFGLVMNQDNGTYTVRRDQEFSVPGHPVFNRVQTFDGEGVSPVSVATQPPGVTATLLARARNFVRRNTGSAQGPIEPATPQDAALVIAEAGEGRVAGHFDRNTFFNLNGAGTSIRRFDNEAYARNLFNWLAGRPVIDPVHGNYAPRLHFLAPAAGAVVKPGGAVTVEVAAHDPDGTISRVELSVNGGTAQELESAPFAWALDPLPPGVHTLEATAVDNSGARTTITTVLQVLEPLERTAWSVAGFRSDGTATGSAAAAIDGNPSTRWTTNQVQTPGQRFVVDFGRFELLGRILLDTTANPNDYPRGYEVRVSENGVEFTTVATGTGSGPLLEVVPALPVAVRFVEIRQTGTAGTFSWWSIHELEMFRPAPDTVLPKPVWLRKHFGADLDDPAREAVLWGDEADADGDGATTLQEFAAGTNPLDAASVFRPELEYGRDVEGGIAWMDISLRRWVSPNGVEQQFETSRDLSNWAGASPVPGEIAPPVVHGDGTETARFRLPLPPGDPSGFVRIRVVEP